MQKWIVVMGVSGSGKSTVAERIANKLKLLFIEADDYHPDSNIQKMKSGNPLNDSDRKPWLESLNNVLLSHKNGAVLSCSALKESYREILSRDIDEFILVFLEGNFSLIIERMKSRGNHFMPTELLQSQFDDLEIPHNSIRINIDQNLDIIESQIINQINKMENENDIGVIGLGVMGSSLARNFVSKDISVSVFNMPLPGEDDVTENFIKDYGNPILYGAQNLEDFIQSLKRPRKVLLMIKSGNPVDEMIEKILPLLSKGDIIIDAGNSFYKDTIRRNKKCDEYDIHFVGMGVSGGEEGALNGPAIMPAGSSHSKKILLPLLDKIAAKYKDEPCVKWIGENGAGHFVKMVHNGIEYADMQLLTEAYSIFKNLLDYGNLQIADTLETWKSGLHNSYLLDITIDILRKKENDEFIIDSILDVAGHKGTGMWTSREALELGVAVPSITAAMNQRIISSYKKDRAALSANGQPSLDTIEKEKIEKHIKEAILAARLIALAEGFHLMSVASDINKWNLNMSDVASVWRGGCIIRSAQLPLVSEAYDSLSNDLINKELSKHLFHNDLYYNKLKSLFPHMNEIISRVVKTHISTPGLSASNNYFKSFISNQLPINLIQAQRDYFGAHTYRRIDNPNKPQHTRWKA